VTAEAPSLDVVLFDVDDTLYSTTEFALQARRSAVRAMVEHGLRVPEEVGAAEMAEVVAEFTSNYAEHFDRLLDRLGPDAYQPVNRSVLVAAGVVAYHRTKERGLKILPDARALLEALATGGIRMGVISAGLQVKQAEKLVRLGVLPWMDPRAIFFTDQMGVSKPNPKLYVKACRALGIAPARVMYVGDRAAHDVVPARRIGMKTVHYVGAHGRWGEQTPSEPADHVVRDFRDLLPVLRDVYALPLA
jgi:putative hydrolase of the HAD superfamily